MSSKKKTTMGIIGNRGSDIMPIALAAALLGGVTKTKRTPEERAAIAERMQAEKDERIRQARILKNICPDCSGKLIRGKKQKKNGYKRTWDCTLCNNVHQS